VHGPVRVAVYPLQPSQSTCTVPLDAPTWAELCRAVIAQFGAAPFQLYYIFSCINTQWIQIEDDQEFHRFLNSRSAKQSNYVLLRQPVLQLEDGAAPAAAAEDVHALAG